MKHFLDMDNWNRREIFDWFNRFDEPLFGACVQIDCTKAYAACKKENASFFLYYLHKVLVACNRIKNFRYRREGNKVVVYDEVHAGPTIARADGSMGFAFIQHNENFDRFCTEARKEVERVKNCTTLFAPHASENLIHFSSLPWIDFTSLSHARWLSQKDCSPKISVGKLVEENGKHRMPLSIHVHHALMDGRHVGEWIELFQQLMDGKK